MHNLLTFHYENLEQRGSTHAIICEKKKYNCAVRKRLITRTGKFHGNTASSGFEICFRITIHLALKVYKYYSGWSIGLS